MHNKRHSIKSAFWHIFYLLFSNISKKIQYREITVNITNQLESFYTLDSAKDVSNAFPTADKIIAIGGRKTQSEYLCIATIENNANLYAFSWAPGEYKVLIIAIY